MIGTAMSTLDLQDRLNAVPDSLLQHDFVGVIEAIDELERITESSSSLDPSWYVFRGVAQYLDSRFEDAIASYESALDIDSHDQTANLNLSYILASCPDSSLHDAEKAIDHARLICETTSWREWYGLQALAGALARAGDFSNAKRQASRAYKFVPADQQWRVTRLIQLIDCQQPFTANLDDDLHKLDSDWAVQIEAARATR